MKRILIFVIALISVLSCSKLNSSTDQEDINTITSSPAKETPTLTVDGFDSNAGKYVDSEVSLGGIVDHVCKHSGKKLKLVTDGGSVHVESETRFDDNLVGNQVQLTGIVREQRIDESTCLQMEEDNIKNHREGTTNQEQYDHKLTQIKHYRDSMAVAGVDHLSYYTLEFVALDKGTE